MFYRCPSLSLSMIQLPRRLTVTTFAALLACSAALAQDSVPTTVPGASRFYRLTVR